MCVCVRVRNCSTGPPLKSYSQPNGVFSRKLGVIFEQKLRFANGHFHPLAHSLTDSLTHSLTHSRSLLTTSRPAQFHCFTLILLWQGCSAAHTIRVDNSVHFLLTADDSLIGCCGRLGWVELGLVTGLVTGQRAGLVPGLG